jgi:hypothetical protein
LCALLLIAWSWPDAPDAPDAPPPPEGLVVTANDDTAFAAPGETIEIDVLANDTGDGDFVLTRIVNDPAFGQAEVDFGEAGVPGDEFIRYTPNQGFVGEDQLVYEIGDESDVDVATVLIFVSRPPVAQPDSAGVTPPAITTVDVLDNDTDPDGDTLVVESILTPPTTGSAAIAQDSLIQYTPDATFDRADSLEYVVTDQRGGRDTTTAYFILNAPPTARADSVTTGPGTTITIDVLANDSDPEGDPLTLASIDQAPDNGTATLVTSGGVRQVRYTPDAGFTGLDSLAYAVRDDFGGRSTAFAFIQVSAPPVAQDDQVTTTFATSITIDVLANDADPEGDPLTITRIDDAPDNGTAQIVSPTEGQRIEYTPGQGFQGTDTFTYAVTDGFGNEDVATVTITVIASASVQVIHSVIGAGEVDVYIDDERVADDLDFREATAYASTSTGAVDIDIVPGTASDNSSPIVSFTEALTPNATYAAVASGEAGGDLALTLAETRLTAEDTDDVDFLIVNGSPNANSIDVRLLDPFDSNRPSEVLANNLFFGTASGYQDVEAEAQNFDVTSADNATVYDAFRIELDAYAGETLVFVNSGRTGEGNTPSLSLLAVDAEGTVLVPDVVTADAPAPELPEQFALHGNYPNPFNPTTTIRFDLPQTAQVTVAVFDLLGRRVLALPSQELTAGANRAIELDAAALPSGTYLYRVTARMADETMTASGEMVLVK